MPIRRAVYPPRKKKAHVIDDISFRKNRIDCSCGFTGTIEEYDEHRRAMQRASASARSHR